ncbi:hypothetical protein Sjap_009676 [Stephania japonica]|uniref:NAC domain-containing protein n=1 Tax=Stephania japonica TaxID=461633 RepID=A0AAP0P3W7_9MAGN
MLAIEEALWEMHAVDTANEQGLPPGYRFHPTDEELVAFYLASKVFNGNFCGVQIAEIDLNRCEPWELPDIGKIGKREWYFFSSRDRKYPTGLRTNRATEAGYWKATGKDKEVYSSTSNCSSNASQQQLIGMKKTLVFYKGRAPRGVKTRWVMHEYRLVGHLASLRTSKEEWVICRIHHKAGAEKIRTNPLLMSQLQTYPSLSINNMITLPPNFLNCSTSTSLETHQFLMPKTLLIITYCFTFTKKVLMTSQTLILLLTMVLSQYLNLISTAYSLRLIISNNVPPITHHLINPSSSNLSSHITKTNLWSHLQWHLMGPVFNKWKPIT